MSTSDRFGFAANIFAFAVHWLQREAINMAYCTNIAGNNLFVPVKEVSTASHTLRN